MIYYHHGITKFTKHLIRNWGEGGRHLPVDQEETCHRGGLELKGGKVQASII